MQAAGDTIQHVVLAIHQVADIVSNIASASSAQSSSIEQISQSVAQLDKMTRKNSALVEQSTAAAASFGDQAFQLTRTLQVFKTVN